LRHLYHHRARTGWFCRLHPASILRLPVMRLFPLLIRIFWRIGGPAGQSSAFSRLSLMNVQMLEKLLLLVDLHREVRGNHVGDLVGLCHLLDGAQNL